MRQYTQVQSLPCTLPSEPYHYLPRPARPCLATAFLFSVCACELHAFPHQDAVSYLCTCCFPWRRAWPTQNRSDTDDNWILRHMDQTLKRSKIASNSFLLIAARQILPHAQDSRNRYCSTKTKNKRERRNISHLFEKLLHESSPHSRRYTPKIAQTFPNI